MLLFEVPEEIRPDIIEVMKRNSTRLVYYYKDLEYLMTLYYRYCVRLYKNETVEAKVASGMRCFSCKADVIMYFKKQLQIWEL